MTAAAWKPSIFSPEYENYLREKRCGHKTQYTAQWIARNAVIALGWAGVTGLEAYFCTFCDYWHVGHPYFRTPRPHEDL